ncbi:MAG: hypothetical protein AB7S41_02335 [Parvibaculaceae bacterium]
MKMKFKTPRYPRKFRNILGPDLDPRYSVLREHYKSIFDYKLGNQNLWGTETFLGDWDGEFLLVAKDFYPTCYIEEARESGERHPYRHNESADTNENLRTILQHFGRYPTDTTNTDCNFLYISACFLLRTDGKKRGHLRHEAKALAVSAPVVAFTMHAMCRLRCVVAMGNEAQRALAKPSLAQIVDARKLKIVHVCHPSVGLDLEKWKVAFSHRRRPAS